MKIRSSIFKVLLKSYEKKRSLIDNGHSLLPYNGIGNVNAIIINGNKLTGYGDPRSENTASGY